MARGRAAAFQISGLTSTQLDSDLGRCVEAPRVAEDSSHHAGPQNRSESGTAPQLLQTRGREAATAPAGICSGSGLGCRLPWKALVVTTEVWMDPCFMGSG